METMKVWFWILLTMCLISAASHAGEYKQFFLDASGRQLSSEEAILASVKGAETFRCQSVEYKVSKSGTSIGLKNIKKPKVEKN